MDFVIRVSKLELQSSYYVHFWTNSHGKVNPPATGSVEAQESYERGFEIKQPMKVDMPLNKPNRNQWEERNQKKLDIRGKNEVLYKNERKINRTMPRKNQENREREREREREMGIKNRSKEV